MSSNLRLTARRSICLISALLLLAMAGIAPGIAIADSAEELPAPAVPPEPEPEPEPKIEVKIEVKVEELVLEKAPEPPVEEVVQPQSVLDTEAELPFSSASVTTQEVGALSDPIAAPKIRICHATGSINNPYTSQTVDTSSTDLSGHGGHTDDIIPFFVAPNGSVQGGVNWAGGGQTFWENNCNHVIVTPEAPTVTPATCNTAAILTTRTTTGIVYTVTVSSVPATSPVTGPATNVVVTATALPGYKFQGNNFTYTFPSVNLAAAGGNCPATAVNPTLNPPSCVAPGSLVITPTTGVEYLNGANVVSGTITTPGIYTITAQPATGSTLTNPAFSYGPVTVLAQQNCATAVAPSLSAPSCDTPGKLTIPTTEGVRYVVNGLTATGDLGPGVYIITVETENDYVLTNPPFTQTITVLPATGFCAPPPTVVAAAAPTVTPATCDAPGALVLATTTGITYTATGPAAGGPGAYVVTAVADAGYSNTGPSSFTITVPEQLEGEECEEPVETIGAAATAPRSTAATCDAPGTLVLPSVTGLSYEVVTGPTGGGAGEYVVRATAAEGYRNTGPSTFTITVPAQLTGPQCGETEVLPIVIEQPAPPAAAPPAAAPPAAAPPAAAPPAAAPPAVQAAPAVQQAPAVQAAPAVQQAPAVQAAPALLARTGAGSAGLLAGSLLLLMLGALILRRAALVRR